MAGCADCFFGGVKIESRGPEDSPFVIVGESPGAMEIHYKKPFVGDSGKVLDRVLKEQGIDELGIEPYYTNAIMCMPRRKDPERLAAACFRCRDRLVEDIQKHPRKVILALGNGALWSATGNFNLKITKERGKLFASGLSQHGIVAAVHPAFLLRGGGNYKQFQNDLKYAIDICREGQDAFKLPNGSTYHIVDTVEGAKEIEEQIRALPAKTLIAQDIETTGFNYMTDEILCMGIQFNPEDIYIIEGALVHNGFFRRDLKQGWHNGKFDLRFLRWRGYSDAFVHADSMLANYATNERRGIHDLDQVASDRLGSPNHKHMVDPYIKGTIIDAKTGKKRKRNYGDIPKDVLYKYTALDLADTYQLIQQIEPEINDDQHLPKFYNEHLLEGSEYLTKVEMNGILVDQVWVDKNSTRLIEEMNKHEQAIIDISREVGFGEVNIRSWQQIKGLLYDTLKLAPSSWATDDDTLEKLPNHPAVVNLRGYRKVQKSYATYVRPLKPPGFVSINRAGKEKEEHSYLYPDGRVHQTYKLHGTATSRLSCADPNAQNIPRDPLLRGMFIPRPGYGILEVDYSQAELRCLAVLSGDEGLLEIFNTGKDLHVEMSIFLFGPNFTKEDKMATKTVNFGIVYGRTAPSIAEDPKLVKARADQGGAPITIAEAQGWIDGWFKRFPKAAEFIEKCRMAPIREQTLITCFGNKKRPGVVSREKVQDLMNESANFFHQSIASNLTVRAGIELFDVLRDDWDTHIINTVHDCIVTETPLNSDNIKMVSNLMVAKMQEIPLRYKGLHGVPFKAEPEFGLRWGNLLKFKEMDELGWDLTKVPDYVAAH